MTKWQEYPLRPQGHPWPGIRTRTGKLDDGSGQMTDESVNVIINKGDQLAKRKGLIRGLDERFAGAVCGLHAYTDERGREYLLVADEGGFSIRQPFSIPSFENSDAYPSDEFEGTGDVNPSFWQDGGAYQRSAGGLVLREPGGGIDMRWFKDAANFSYQLEGGWTIATDSRVAFVIKQGAVARIEGRITDTSGTVRAALVWIDATGTEHGLGFMALPEGSTTGVLTVSYRRDVVRGTFTAQLDAQPAGGDAVQVQDHETINALSDADLGQGTALRLESAVSSPSVLIVQGGPL